VGSKEVTPRNASSAIGSLQRVTFLQSVTAFSIPAWREFPGLVHGFLGRLGGVSPPPFDSLNLSYAVGDDPVNVKKNWHAWRSSWNLAEAPVITPKQIHGTGVVEVSSASPEEPIEADALWTRHPGLHLGVLTADCVPILIVEPESRLACAAHAGWRGTSREIAIKAVEALERSGSCSPSSLFAALGPSIGACCYPVGKEVFDAFPRRWRSIGWSQIEGRHHLDLRELNAEQLIAAGLEKGRISVVGPCTSCRVTDFFSSRRSGGQTGRQLSFVGWT
jgi:YfiH family protein